MQLAAGTQVTTNVRLVRELGRGGMGAVWVAEHQSLGTEVAVKFIIPSADDVDAQSVERFQIEARSAAQIKSPHVVHTYDHGVMADGTQYIVMELLRGESLASRLERGPLELADTALVIDQVSKALSYAHAQGIVHRDIKPDNIFLQDAHGEVFAKVLDFGIAKQTVLPDVPSVTATGMVIGTPEFMSPEQLLRVEGVDHYVDLWALAVVAYYALVGQLPFVGETLISLCLEISKGSYPPPTQVNPALVPELDSFFAKALHVDRQQRFASAAELAAQFRQVIDAAAPATGSQRQAAPMVSGTTPIGHAVTTPAQIGAIPSAAVATVESAPSTGGAPAIPLGQVGSGPVAPPAAAVQSPPRSPLAWIGWLVAALLIVGMGGAFAYRSLVVGSAESGRSAKGKKKKRNKKKNNKKDGDRTSKQNSDAAAASATASSAAGPASAAADDPAPSSPPSATAPDPNAPAAPTTKPPLKNLAGKPAIRGALMSCWNSHEGGKPGQPGRLVTATVTTDANGRPRSYGGVFGPAPRKFKDCAWGTISRLTFPPHDRFDVSVRLPRNNRPTR